MDQRACSTIERRGGVLGLLHCEAHWSSDKRAGGASRHGRRRGLPESGTEQAVTNFGSNQSAWQRASGMCCGPCTPPVAPLLCATPRGMRQMRLSHPSPSCSATSAGGPSLPALAGCQCSVLPYLGASRQLGWAGSVWLQPDSDTTAMVAAGQPRARVRGCAGAALPAQLQLSRHIGISITTGAS